MTNCDVYGIKEGSLEETRAAIEQVVGVRFVLHESDYYGGDYYRTSNLGEEHFILLNNFNPFDKEWIEEEFSEYKIILYVNETIRAREIEKLLTNSTPEASLLRRESC